MHEDTVLLRRYAEARAEDAFAELVQRHVNAVYSAALRRVGNDTHLAEDVTQHVFVALARRAAIVAHHPHLTGWLYITTRNEAANAVRAERRRKAREQEALIMQESAFEPDAEVQWSRIAPLIDREIDGLNDRDRAAVLLRFIENRTFAEIGASLQLTEDAARMRLERALEKVRVSLARRGIASTSAALSLALTQYAVAAAPATLAASASAVAATTAPAALTLLQLMTATKLSATSAATLALLVLSLGTATYEISRAHTITASLLSARANDSALTARLRALEAQATAAERDAAQLAQKLHDEETAAAESARLAAIAAAAAAKAAAWDPTAEGTAFMQRHPAVRQALADWFDGQTNYRYSAFYAQAGLTQEQIAQFLLLNRSGWLGRGVGPTSPFLQFQLNPSDSWGEADNQIRALLGPEKSRQYSDYLATLKEREFGAQLASSLAFSTAPLTATQFDQLTRALVASHAVQFTRTGPTYDWTLISQSAAAALSPAQREALAALQAKAEFDAAYNRAASATP